jgi:hypothetical protein
MTAHRLVPSLARALAPVPTITLRRPPPTAVPHVIVVAVSQPSLAGVDHRRVSPRTRRTRRPPHRLGRQRRCPGIDAKSTPTGPATNSDHTPPPHPTAVAAVISVGASSATLLRAGHMGRPRG